MRERLFKAIRDGNKKWIEGIPIKTNGETFIISERNPRYNAEYDYMEIEGLHKVKEKTICQYIEMDDRNGNRIFEHDIVRENDNGYIGKVYYENGQYKIKWKDKERTLREDIYYWVKEKRIEVIGNIFDRTQMGQRLSKAIIKPQWKNVSKEEFEEFVESYPVKLDVCETTICTPMLLQYIDFRVGGYPDGAVALEWEGNSDPKDLAYMPESERYLIAENYKELLRISQILLRLALKFKEWIGERRKAKMKQN